MLALVREVAADAASPTDSDECLRRLRAGLIRFGFTRAGIWVTDGTDSPIGRGSWGTNWDGTELDEHGLIADLRTFPGAAQILRGEHVCLSCVEPGPGERVSDHRSIVKQEGPPNQACVALRADNQLLAIISVDMLPSTASIDPEQVAALEVVADHVAVAIARGRAASALRAELAERRVVEESLRVSEERQRSLFDGAPIGLYRTVPGGEIIDVNQALLELLGYGNLEELRAVGVQHTFVNPDDRVEYETTIMRDGIVKRFEMQLRRRDGEVIWVEDNGRIVRDANGKAQFYEGSIQDITDRKRAEDALRESEERLRFTIEHTGDVIYRLSFSTQRYDYMSPSIERLIGYTVDELQEVGWEAITEERTTLQGLKITSDYIARYRTTEGIGSYQS